MTTTHQQNRRRTAAASLVGTAVEYYDFALYGAAAAVVFSTVYFPAVDPTAAILASFATYAVGFVVRPLGGILFGSLGDRIGRKPTLIATLLLMGTATFLIGCVPGYDAIGVWAAVILIALRMLQGIGAGAEYAGAAVLSTEAAGPGRGGFLGSLPAAGSWLGSLLAIVVFQVITLLQPDAFLSWGWRIAFFLALPLLLVSLWIRVRVQESEEFTETQKVQTEAPRRSSLADLFRQFKLRTVIGLGLNLTLATFGYVLQVFSISYLIREGGMDTSVSLLISAIGYGLGIFTVPFWGFLADKVGPSRIFITANVLTILYIIPFWLMLSSKDFVLAIIAIVIGLPVLVSAQFATQPIIYKRLFPVSVRYTGVAISREVTGAAVGGTMPLIAAAAIAAASGSWVPLSIGMMFAAAVALVAAIAAARMKQADSVEDSLELDRETQSIPR